MTKTEKLNATITAALDQAVAEGVPLMDAVNSALSALAVFSTDREGPHRAGLRLQHLGDMLTSPEMLVRHARTLN